MKKLSFSKLYSFIRDSLLLGFILEYLALTLTELNLMIQVCFNVLVMEWKFFSNGMFSQVAYRKPSILLTTSGAKPWDVLLVVLLTWLWGRLAI